MAANGMRDDVPPWSFFLPVTVAVVVGILIADGVRYAVRQVFDDPVPSPAAETAAPRASAVDAPSAADPPAADADAERAAAVTDVDTDSTQAPESPAAESPSVPAAASAESAGPALPALPGPVSAKRDGAERACINGTVARRSGNGWEQVTENDAPLRCSADSP